MRHELANTCSEKHWVCFELLVCQLLLFWQTYYIFWSFLSTVIINKHYFKLGTRKSNWHHALLKNYSDAILCIHWKYLSLALEKYFIAYYIFSLTFLTNLLNLLTNLSVDRESAHVSSHNQLLVNFRLDNNNKILHFCQPILRIAGRAALRKLRWSLQASNTLGCTDQSPPRIVLLSSSAQGEISKNNILMAKCKFSMKKKCRYVLV